MTILEGGIKTRELHWILVDKCGSPAIVLRV